MLSRVVMMAGAIIGLINGVIGWQNPIPGLHGWTGFLLGFFVFVIGAVVIPDGPYPRNDSTGDNAKEQTVICD